MKALLELVEVHEISGSTVADRNAPGDAGEAHYQVRGGFHNYHIVRVFTDCYSRSQYSVSAICLTCGLKWRNSVQMPDLARGCQEELGHESVKAIVEKIGLIQSEPVES